MLPLRVGDSRLTLYVVNATSTHTNKAILDLMSVKVSLFFVSFHG